jgi:hypothetical protein
LDQDHMTNPVKGQPMGFDLVSTGRGQDRRTVARFICFKCEKAFIDLSVISGVRLNPTLLAQSAERHGWDADSVRRARVVCPDCKTGRTNDVASELRKMEVRMATAPTALLIGSASAPVSAVREPTADQRVVIRHLLEKHFDEGRGCYLDGYNDQRIAEDTGLARIVVERLRDAAYGPIRVTAEVLAARKELDDMLAKLATLQDDAVQWAQQFGEELDRMRERVRQLQTAMAGKAAA